MKLYIFLFIIWLLQYNRNKLYKRRNYSFFIYTLFIIKNKK